MSASDVERILFIGNSFTARNDLPAMVRQIAEACGRSVETELISAGGASLRMHWNRGEAQREIATGRYGAAVLQEQSTLPVKNAARMRENVLLFDEAIRASGARTVLYMTWARRHEPQNQEVITRAYRSIGEEIGATVVPAGEAWQRFLADHAAPPLHDADGSHPTPAGTYLAACVFAKTLLDIDPDTIAAAWSPAGIDPETAALLARCA